MEKKVDFWITTHPNRCISSQTSIAPSVLSEQTNAEARSIDFRVVTKQTIRPMKDTH